MTRFAIATFDLAWPHALNRNFYVLPLQWPILSFVEYTM